MVRVGEAGAVKLELFEAKEPEGDTVVVTVGVVLALAQPLTVAETEGQFEDVNDGATLAVALDEELPVAED